jgi:hypothetical protein
MAHSRDAILPSYDIGQDWNLMNDRGLRHLKVVILLTSRKVRVNLSRCFIIPACFLPVWTPINQIHMKTWNDPGKC